MKITLAAVTLVTGLVIAPAALAAEKEYKATINDAQETSCTTLDSKATGVAALTYDDATGKLTGTVTLTPNGDLADVTAVHLHDGTCGKTGGVNTGLPNPTANVITVNDTIPMPDRADFGKALDDGALYINIHSTACGSGEIRGQVYPKASTETCPAGGGTDAGTDSGTTSSSGGSSSGGSSSGGSSSGGSSSGASTTRPDSGTESAAAPAEDDGCSTSGGSPTNGVLVALGAGIALAGIARGRRKKK